MPVNMVRLVSWVMPSEKAKVIKAAKGSKQSAIIRKLINENL